DLAAVVEEGRAARGEEDRVRELAARDGGPGLVHEAPGVVQAGQGDEHGGVRIEAVMGEHDGELAQRLPLREGAPDRIERRKVEQRVDSAVDAVARDAAL